MFLSQYCFEIKIKQVEFSQHFHFNMIGPVLVFTFLRNFHGCEGNCHIGQPALNTILIGQTLQHGCVEMFNVINFLQQMFSNC